jgi:WD40 repeat protein
MRGSPPLSFVLIDILCAFSNLMQADPPARGLAGIHEFGTTAFACTPNGRRFISGGFRGGLRIQDAATLRPNDENHGHRLAMPVIMQRYQAHELCGAVIRFSPDGQTLASASDDESVRPYRVDQAHYSSSGEIPPAH